MVLAISPPEKPVADRLLAFAKATAICQLQATGQDKGRDKRQKRREINDEQI